MNLGAADLYDERMIQVIPNAYSKHLLLHKSGRFAKDPRFVILPVIPCFVGKLCKKDVYVLRRTVK